MAHLPSFYQQTYPPPPQHPQQRPRTFQQQQPVLTQPQSPFPPRVYQQPQNIYQQLGQQQPINRPYPTPPAFHTQPYQQPPLQIQYPPAYIQPIRPHPHPQSVPALAPSHPPVAPSAALAQQAQAQTNAQLQALNRRPLPLPSQKRADTLPSPPKSPSPSRRPLPTPSTTKHQSIDLARFSLPPITTSVPNAPDALSPRTLSPIKTIPASVRKTPPPPPRRTPSPAKPPPPTHPARRTPSPSKSAAPAPTQAKRRTSPPRYNSTSPTKSTPVDTKSYTYPDDKPAFKSYTFPHDKPALQNNSAPVNDKPAFKSHNPDDKPAFKSYTNSVPTDDNPVFKSYTNTTFPDEKPAFKSYTPINDKSAFNSHNPDDKPAFKSYTNTTFPHDKPAFKSYTNPAPTDNKPVFKSYTNSTSSAALSASLLSGVPGPGQGSTKFIPLWKRAQMGDGVGPGFPPDTKMAPPVPPAPVSAAVRVENNPTDAAGRPLPSAPAASRPGSAFASGGQNAMAAHRREIAQSGASVVSTSDEEEEEEEEETDEENQTESQQDEYEEDEDDDDSSRQPPSPQYGIRDLPSRGVLREVKTKIDMIAPKPKGTGLPRPPAMVVARAINASDASGVGQWDQRREQGQGHERGRQPGEKVIAGGQRAPGEERRGHKQGQSMTLRFAEAEVEGRESAGRVEADGWPVDVPRLPRAPGIGAGSAYNSTSDGWNGRGREREMVDLSDSPPLSLRRTPSPSPTQYQQQHSLQHQQTASRRELPQPQNASRSQSNSRQQQQVEQRQVQPSQQQQQQPHYHQQYQQHQAHQIQPRQPQSQPQREPDPQPHHMQPQPHQPQPRHSYQQQQHTQEDQRQWAHDDPPAIRIEIESPAPMGGRDKMADIPRISYEGEHEPQQHRQRQQQHQHQQGQHHQYQHQYQEQQGGPMINVQEFDHGPSISVSEHGDGGRGNGPPKVHVFEVPGISLSGPENGPPSIAISAPAGTGTRGNGDEERFSQQHQQQQHNQQRHAAVPHRGGLICGGCGGPIIGRIVSAMGARWHPGCFQCTVCNALLEHVSSYEHDGRPYCHLDYHENFAPRCYTCKTAIIEERFISLDDPALGKRTYHEQHFFCAECGDPFLAPNSTSSSSAGVGGGRTGELSVSGDGEFESDDVGFTVYKGHPYCESCHVRLRLPKCRACKRSIRDGDEAVEALGGKYCWGCFVCARCQKPFEHPSFYERNEQPFCEDCFSIILRNEV